MTQVNITHALVFSKELLATANALAEAAERLKGLARALQKKTADPTQLWYWTEEWQKAERKADEDIKRGKYKTYRSVDNLIADLSKAAKKHDEISQN